MKILNLPKLKNDFFFKTKQLKLITYRTKFVQFNQLFKKFSCTVFVSRTFHQKNRDLQFNKIKKSTSCEKYLNYNKNLQNQNCII